MSVLYSEIRDEIETGDLLAWRIKHVGSFTDLILLLYQKILKARFSHVGIAVKIGNRYFLLDATPPVVRLIPISMTGDFYLIKTNLKVKPRQVDLLLEHIGKKYDLIDLVRGVFGIKKNKDNFYCSELANYFYKKIGFVSEIDTGLTPDCLINYVVQKHSLTIVEIKNDRGNLNVL